MKSLFNVLRSLVLIPIVAGINIAAYRILIHTVIQWYLDFFHYIMQFKWYWILIVMVVIGRFIVALIQLAGTLISKATMMFLGIATFISPHKIYAFIVIVFFAVLTGGTLLVQIWLLPLVYNFWSVIFCLSLTFGVVGFVLEMVLGALIGIDKSEKMQEKQAI